MQSASRLIKDTLDKQYGPQWHVVVGEGFSFDVTAQVSIFYRITTLGFWPSLYEAFLQFAILRILSLIVCMSSHVIL